MNKKHILFHLSEARKALEGLIRDLHSRSQLRLRQSSGRHRALVSPHQFSSITASTQHGMRVTRWSKPQTSVQKKIFVVGGSFLLACRYCLKDELSRQTMYLTARRRSASL